LARWSVCGFWILFPGNPASVSIPEEDVRQALAYAAWKAEEVELPLTVTVSQPEWEEMPLEP
jgi:hypothetical protein